MLKSDKFWVVMWSIINKSKGDEGKLKKLLSSEEEGVITLFEREFRRAMSNISDIEVAGSGDMKKDIFAHVVSKGSKYYDEIVSHPDRIPQDVGPNDPCFYGVAGQVFWEKFHKELQLE